MQNYEFYLINKNNLNCVVIYNLDSLIIKSGAYNNIFSALQTFFFDLKIFIKHTFTGSLKSISNVYQSNLWVERELKEFNNVNFYNLMDTRKLLSNYNYNHSLNYNQYSNIINDINI